MGICRYVLPTFEVVVDVDSTYLVLRDSSGDGISGRVTGIYTYGEGVSGDVDIHLWQARGSGSGRYSYSYNSDYGGGSEPAGPEYTLVRRSIQCGVPLWT